MLFRSGISSMKVFKRFIDSLAPEQRRRAKPYKVGTQFCLWHSRGAKWRGSESYKYFSKRAFSRRANRKFVGNTTKEGMSIEQPKRGSRLGD